MRRAVQDQATSVMPEDRDCAEAVPRKVLGPGVL